MTKVLIPTCRSISDLNILDELNRISPELPIVINSSNNSAAFNRNRCLEQIEIGELVIMIDDDISGFFVNWAKLLVEPMLYDSDIVMIAARLMKLNGNTAYMMGENYDLTKKLTEVEQRRLPTACIAFRHDGTLFKEEFIGSGFEDTSFCKDLGYKYPNGKFMINNNVKLIHLNEMKNQKGDYWKHNKALFVKLYPEEYEREYK